MKFSIDKLIEAQDNRGTMSHLARWWSPRTRHYAYPMIGKLFGGWAIGKPEFEIPAALFAIHPMHSPKIANTGQTCKNIAGKKAEGFEPHFRRLLAAGSIEGDLDQLLHRLGKRAKAESVAINFDQLSEDLRRWKWNHESIKITWAKSYWASVDEAKLELPSES